MLSVLSIKLRRFGDKVQLADELITTYMVGLAAVGTYCERILSSCGRVLRRFIC